MDKLQELYAKRKVFEDYGISVPAELAAEIEQEKRNILLKAPYWFMEHAPQNVGLNIPGNYAVHLEYSEGRLVGIGASYDFQVKERSDVYLKNGGGEGGGNQKPDDEPIDPPYVPRSKSIKFSVTFPDGKVFNYNKAQWTFIESLKHMGLERAARYTKEKFKGFPLVGKQQRVTPNGQQWQKFVDGWWIYINMSNERKVQCLQGVAAMLNIPIVIRWEESKAEDVGIAAEPSDEKPDQKSKIARFSLNGSEPMGKNRSVLETVRRFISQFPDATYEDVEEMFPQRLQGSYGVVRTIGDITDRCAKNKSEGDRWFLDPTEVLSAGDGTRFAVSKEWGNQFPTFQKHLADTFGWILEEA